MRALILLCLLPLGAVAQSPSTPATPKPPPAAPLSADECAVWSRELGFAQALADHDAAAFAAHLHPDAVFGASLPQPTRGREAITRDWSSLIEGKDVRLSWYPTRTAIAGDGDIAYSSGPALFEHLAAGAKTRYSLSRFQSVWLRGADGVWRVLFDDGVRPRPATEAEVAGFHAGRQAACPSP